MVIRGLLVLAVCATLLDGGKVPVRSPCLARLPTSENSPACYERRHNDGRRSACPPRA